MVKCKRWKEEAMNLNDLDFARGLRPQRNDQLRLSVKLRGVQIDTWDRLRKTLQLTPTELVGEALRALALIAFNQEKGFQVRVLAPGTDEPVDLVEYLGLSKPVEASGVPQSVSEVQQSAKA